MKTKITEDNINQIAEEIVKVVNDKFPGIPQEDETWDNSINPFIDTLISEKYDVGEFATELDELIGIEIDNLSFGTHY
jgi:hypothetical protein